ncbi:hypothetical protein Q8W30_11510 [Neptunomonas phycophila]|uniref:DUF1127 domain-containing protein n=1 Tax=Neptunomonas phycophila TaxID=1572645 RepID=A0ABT9EW76_9GAMM|nr:hypothetical protein [Neptunomonas phycophila]MDP2523199.1 hypothetical protein [Neptunomonas phycophila]
MTFLGLIKAGFDALQQRAAAAYTYQSMEHLDDRLLRDVGLLRQGNRVVSINADLLNGAQKTSPSIVMDSQELKTTSVICSRLGTNDVAVLLTPDKSTPPMGAGG